MSGVQWLKHAYRCFTLSTCCSRLCGPGQEADKSDSASLLELQPGSQEISKIVKYTITNVRGDAQDKVALEAQGACNDMLNRDNGCGGPNSNQIELQKVVGTVRDARQPGCHLVAVSIGLPKNIKHVSALNGYVRRHDAQRIDLCSGLWGDDDLGLVEF